MMNRHVRISGSYLVFGGWPIQAFCWLEWVVRWIDGKAPLKQKKLEWATRHWRRWFSPALNLNEFWERESTYRADAYQSRTLFCPSLNRRPAIYPEFILGPESASDT